MSPSENILITGANGFLGSEIVRQAAVAGLAVHATDRQDLSGLPVLDYHQADILDVSSLKPIMRAIDCVVHVAGLAHVFDKAKAEKAPFKEINEIGTANVARVSADAGVKRFILISSVSVYGSFTNGVFDESAPCRPEGKYAESKYRAELRAVEIAKQSGMALAVLRLATLYGEGDPGNVARLMKAIDGERFIWFGKGLNRKSLLHKSDAARAVLAASRKPCSGINFYNVSAPVCSMRDIVRALASALGKKVPGWVIPESWALVAARIVSGAMRGKGPLGNLRSTIEKWLADDAYSADKFEKTYDFQTQVGLADGLRAEVEWYRGEVRDQK